MGAAFQFLFLSAINLGRYRKSFPALKNLKGRPQFLVATEIEMPLYTAVSILQMSASETPVGLLLLTRVTQTEYFTYSLLRRLIRALMDSIVRLSVDGGLKRENSSAVCCTNRDDFWSNPTIGSSETRNQALAS